jgi:hypothetical protein
LYIPGIPPSSWNSKHNKYIEDQMERIRKDKFDEE